MMVSRVPPPALPDLRPALRLAGPARPLVSVQERGTAGLAARGRRAAPHQSQAPARLGRPSRHGRADPVPAREAASTPAGHPWYRPSVAPSPGHQEVDLSSRRGPTASQCRDRCADRAARRREPRLGIPADPRRTAQARPPGQRIHDPPGPQGAEDPSGAQAAHRLDLAAVPARASRDDARHRLLPRGLRGHPPAPVLLVRDGDRLPLRAHPRRDRQPGRAMDHPADPEPPDGPR